jgi:hypothetical protein
MVYPFHSFTKMQGTQTRSLRVKDWYKSLTLQGCIVSFLGLAAWGLTPEFGDRAAQCAEIFGREDIAAQINAISPYLVAAGVILSGAGKLRQGTIFTPKAAWGPTKRKRTEGGGS